MMGFPPQPTSTMPSHGKPGTLVSIFGSGLAGSTSVQFGSVSATFTVVDDTHINTVVPEMGSSIATPIQVTNLYGSASIDFTPWYPGPWVQPPADYWGDRRSPYGSFITSNRQWPSGDSGLSSLPQSDIYGPTDNSGYFNDTEPTFWVNGTGYGDLNVDPVTSEIFIEQGQIVIDTQPVWDNTPFTYNLHFAMDPHPIAALPDIDPPGAAVGSFGERNFEWESPDTLDDHGTFEGKYRFTVIARGNTGAGSETSSLVIQLRRLPAGTYIVGTADLFSGSVSSTPIVNHCLFSAALAVLPVQFHFVASDFHVVYGPPDFETHQTMGTYELREDQLESRKHALIVTNNKYVAGAAFTPSDDTQIGIYTIGIEFFYLPSRYRYFFLAPQNPPASGAHADHGMIYRPAI